jgi:hypothetical protein
VLYYYVPYRWQLLRIMCAIIVSGKPLVPKEKVKVKLSLCLSE